MAEGDPKADAPTELPRLVLRDPLPAVVDTAQALHEAAQAVRGGHGPVAVDAERASGYRYSQRAYLVQLRRAGPGTMLIDPTCFDDLKPLDAAIGDAEWILHAATQDLPCLRQLGMRPRRLFDTELAGRLLNLPRVGLAALTGELLGSSLAKEHSAADWSTRPLPQPWLEYAALDVEVLIELREVLTERLRDADKLEWAAEEFEALTRFTGPVPRPEPWRRVSGIHRARGRRALGIVRALWQSRETLAAATDTAPGRLLRDAAIVEAAVELPKGRPLRSLPAMRSRGARRHLQQWTTSVDDALRLPESSLPAVAPHHDGPPPARTWAERDPSAAARLAGCRGVLQTIALDHDLPAENLLAPEHVRQLAWEPPDPADAVTVAATLTSSGARRWQVELTAASLSEILSTVPPGMKVG